MKFDGNIAPAVVFWNEATEVNEAEPAGVESDYNVFYGSGAKKIGAHDQTAPAGFISESTMNLGLTAGSGSGSNTATPPTTPRQTSTATRAPTPPTPAPPNTPAKQTPTEGSNGTGGGPAHNSAPALRAFSARATPATQRYLRSVALPG